MTQHSTVKRIPIFKIAAIIFLICLKHKNKNQVLPLYHISVGIYRHTSKEKKEKIRYIQVKKERKIFFIGHSQFINTEIEHII